MNKYYSGLSDDEQTIFIKRDLEHVLVDVWDTGERGKLLAENIVHMLNDYKFLDKGEIDD